MTKKQNIKSLKVVWQMLMYRPWLFAFNITLWTLVFVYPIAPGVITREFFNRLTDNTQINNSILWILALLVAAGAAHVLSVYFGGYFDRLHNFSLTGLIRRNMLDTIFKKHGAQCFKGSSGEALNCFRDDVDTITDTLGWMLDMAGCFMFTIIAFVIMFSIDPLITLVLFIPANVIVILAKRANKRIEKYRRASRKHTSNISGVIGEIFTSVQGIKVSGTEKNMIKHVNKLNRKRHKAMLKDTLFTQLLNSVYENTLTIGTGVILLLVAKAMKNGSFSVGDFALFIYFLEYISDFVQRLGGFMAHLKHTEVSVDRIAALLEGDNIDSLVEHNPLYIKREVPKPIKDTNFEENSLEKLEVKGLNYTYPNSKNGIKDINFTVEKGSFTVITGRIGSGKTTLLRSLLGLMPVECGEIYWNDEKIQKPDLFFTPSRAAYTAQIPHLFSDTLRENIALGELDENIDINSAIYSAVLEDDIAALEKGTETLIGPLGMKLSGGQIQRVAAARMFARNANLLVFDDISSALDIETENKLWKRLFEKNNSTCIAVSNKKLALHHADNIIVLKDGAIEAQGNLDELLESCDEFKKIWGKEIVEAV